MNTITEEMTLWYEMHRLQERYVGTIDADRLEEWPDLFTDAWLVLGALGLEAVCASFDLNLS